MILWFRRISTQDGWTNNLPLYTSSNITHCRRPRYLVKLLAFLPWPCNQGTLPGEDVKNQRNTNPHQKCWFIGFLQEDPNLTKGRNLSTTLWCKLEAFLKVCNVSHTQQACNWDDQIMVEVIKIFYSACIVMSLLAKVYNYLYYAYSVPW